MTVPLPIAGALRELGPKGSRVLLLATSRDPDAKVTALLGTASGAGDGLVCKVPTTEVAREAVGRERDALTWLRREALGALGSTVPRRITDAAGLAAAEPPLEVLVSTHVPGRPMSVGYHRWRHTARRRPVVADVEGALGWLESLWSVTRGEAAPFTWADEVAAELSLRYDATTTGLRPALDQLAGAHALLAAHSCPRTVVHGDFWFGNVLVHDGAVTGVVDWEGADRRGWPLRDVARFLLSYSLYLDRHTGAGRAVAGHPGLRRGQNASTLPYALLGDGWYPELVRARLVRALDLLGLPAELWYPVALTGLGEVAARANHDQFGHDHLQVLAAFPSRSGMDAP